MNEEAQDGAGGLLRASNFDLSTRLQLSCGSVDQRKRVAGCRPAPILRMKRSLSQLS